MSITNGIKKSANNLFEKFTYLPLTKENFFIAANITLHRRKIALSSQNHPSSEPYLSGDSFTYLADHVLNDGNLVIQPETVKAGDVVFVNSHLLHYFFRSIHPLIKEKYVLISQNGDITIDVPLASYVDRKIIQWYAQNVVVKHSKITPIPIGLENLFYYNHGVPELFDRIKKEKREKETKILMEFSLHTNPIVRKPIYELLRNHKLVYRLHERLSAPRYLELLAQHQFVLSPPGNGLDCHRTWEAMYLGTVPIVERSISTEYFESLGLPMLVVNDWKEVLGFSEKKLEKIYLEIQARANKSPLWYEYWSNKIKSSATKNAK